MTEKKTKKKVALTSQCVEQGSVNSRCALKQKVEKGHNTKATADSENRRHCFADS